MRIAIALAIAVGVAACSNGTPRANDHRPFVPLAFDAAAGATRVAATVRAERLPGPTGPASRATAHRGHVLGRA